MEQENRTYVRIARAALLLGVSEDTVRRMVAAGRLEGTTDPAVLEAAASGRGRRPGLLVSLRSVDRALSERVAAAQRERSSDRDDLLARVSRLERELSDTRAQLMTLQETAVGAVRDEVSRLRAELSNQRQVALQGMARDDALEDAERARLESERLRIEAELARLEADKARRAQLRVFLVPDLIDLREIDVRDNG